MPQNMLEDLWLQNSIMILWFIFLLIYVMAHSWGENNTKHISKEDHPSENKKETILKTLEREEIGLEWMMIKEEEIEAEIHSLKYDITSSFEEEKKNEMNIRKNELSLKQVKMKIKERRENIEKLKKELWETC